jgi:hypothetical protein
MKMGRRFSVSEQTALSELADIDMNTVNKYDLVDVSGFTFDNTVPMEQRAARVMEMVKNPYCFRVGDVGVKIEFTDNAPSLHDVFTDFLKRQKSGL